MSSVTYDVVIIGGGTADLVLANRLTEDPELQVVVHESGEDRGADPNTLTPGAWPLLSNSPADWTFHTAPQNDLGRHIKIPQGRALGGSNAINNFLFTSTSRADVEEWKNLGNKGWGYDAFEQALKRSFTLHKRSVVKGNGPLQLTLAEPEGLREKAWIDGLESVGFPKQDALSGRLGGPIMAPESINLKTKQRSYAANAPSTSEDAIARGVQFNSKGGDSQIINARKEVIISAGAINSPRILELSGIGGADLLEDLGIDVVVDNPHVGENLQNHLFTGLVFEVRDEVDTIDAFFRQEPDAVAVAMQDYGSKGTGPLSTSNMVTMAQLPLPEFHTEDGRKELDQLLNITGPDLDAPRHGDLRRSPGLRGLTNRVRPYDENYDHPILS
ncbi:hypothetical protein VMCG_10805 [Cytospora schulzeri]|uniref:Glucose-methanol-choline oxidoreductase N-terminal domain-containing protein n=1 Tax=Cytospora schulzeri TaxID=448051 RepID=A0A423V7U2_9PEZI|nr:hypothetical protein VMCG_10805 [Valsa malicola]